MFWAFLVVTWLAVVFAYVPNETLDLKIPKTFPNVTGAKLGYIYIADHLYIVDYHTANASHDITRAIIVVHGKNRDAWNYYRAVKSAVQVAGVNESSVFIVAPEFLNNLDFGLAKPTSLIWKG
jgi:hypothetical protein